MNILGQIESDGVEFLKKLEPAPAAAASPSGDNIAKTLPALSAIIAWLAKEGPAIQAGATIAERLAALAALFNVPGAADAELGIEIAVEDIPAIVALGQEILPVLATLTNPSIAPRWLGAPRAI